MKKAFCEPKNITFCPPIELISAFGFGFSENATGEVTIKRSTENGGDILFNNRSQLEAAFADELLHPGDLKNAVSTRMVETLEKVAQAIKADGEVTKASKALKTLEKRLAKDKNKK